MEVSVPVSVYPISPASCKQSTPDPLDLRLDLHKPEPREIKVEGSVSVEKGLLYLKKSTSFSTIPLSRFSAAVLFLVVVMNWSSFFSSSFLHTQEASHLILHLCVVL